MELSTGKLLYYSISDTFYIYEQELEQEEFSRVTEGLENWWLSCAVWQTYEERLRAELLPTES